MDIALVASPTSFHYEQVKLLSQYNIHVFCEKPLAVDAGQAAELVDIFKANGRILQVGFYRRFHNTANFIKNAILHNTYGSLRNIVCHCGWVAKDLPNSILNKNLSGGGISLDYGVHIIDRLLSWSKDMRILSYQDDNLGGIETSAVIEIEMTTLYGGKASVTVRLSWSNVMSNAFHLTFDKAYLICGLNTSSSLEIINLRNQHTDIRYTAQKETLDMGVADPVEAQWTEFFATINGGSPQYSSLSDSIQAIKLINDCYKIRKALNTSWGL